MKIRFWGTRGSLAKPGRSTIRYGGNTSCVELRSAAGTLVVFDCGTGAHDLGLALVGQQAAPLRGHLFISHTHWDHIQGIPFFEPFFQPGGEWDVYGPKGLLQSIRETLAGQMEHNYFPIGVDKFRATLRYHDLVEGEFAIDDLQVATQYLNHPALTLGYRVQADGATMAYCCDHEPSVAAAASGEIAMTGHDSHHVDFLRGAQVVIHDAQFTAEEYPGRIGWGHSTAEYVVAACGAAGVRQVILTHHDPLRDDDAVDAMVARQCRRVAGRKPPMEVLAAAEGQVVEVAPAPVGERPEPRESQQPASHEGVRRPVLMQVPDLQLARLLTEALRLEGLPEPETLRPGVEPRVAAAEGYSFALIQHDPPAVDGLGLLRRLRAMQPGSDARLPVVLLTGNREQAVTNTGVTADWLFTPCSLAYARTKLRFLTLRLACRWARARPPDNEVRRLAELHGLAILDTPREERFDRIARIAATSLGVPIALISLVDQDRQWFKSCIGLDVRETPREVAFCAHAVEQGADVVVPDTLLDERFADNPLVTDGPRIRFYAGAPLLTGSGSCLGTLCVVDTRPRELDAAGLAMLHDLRDMAVEQLLRPARSDGAPGQAQVE